MKSGALAGQDVRSPFPAAEMAGAPSAAGPDVVDGAPAGSLASAWYGLFVLVLTMLFAYVDRQILNLIAPSLQTSLGFTDLQIGMLQGLGMAIFATIASYPMGWLADRFGRRLILALGVACWSLATGFSAFQSGFAGLFVGTIGIAIGEAGLAPIVYAMIPDLFPERRRSAANFIMFGATLLGAGVGMALSGAMLHWLAGSQHGLPAWLAHIDTWRIAMLAVAAPGPLFVLLVATMPLGGRRLRGPAHHAARQGAPLDFLPYARAHWRTLAGFFGAIFAMNISMSSGLIWFPLALPRVFAIDPTTVGVGLGAAVAVATVIGVVLPGIVLRLWRRPAALGPLGIARIFVGLAALPAAFLPFVASPVQAYGLAALQGAMGVAGSALMPGVLQDLAPPHLRSRVLAILGITTALSLAVSPMAIGFISGLIAGPRGILQAMTIVSLPCLVTSAVLFSLTRGPYAATVQALQPQSSGEQT
jgi:MFS family permease